MQLECLASQLEVSLQSVSNEQEKKQVRKETFNNAIPFLPHKESMSRQPQSKNE